MNKTKIFIALLSSILFSCSTNVNKDLKKNLTRKEELFHYTDKNGQYRIRLSSGFNKKSQAFFTKRSMEIFEKEDNNTLEQSVVISELGSIKKKQIMLRPKWSQYSVWFEGKKYFSEMKINPVKKAIDLKLVSPEAKWSGDSQVKLPSTKAMYCFFSQVIECAKASGFISMANKQQTGSMNFYIIWEGYPYLNETYTDFPNEMISKAVLDYDEKTKEGEPRFNLKVVGQSIFYVLDEREQLKKMFWVSQGISMVNKASYKAMSKEAQKKINQLRQIQQ